MKVLVTGASGFVGKPLCKELQQEGHSVIAATRSSSKFFNNVDVVNVGEINGNTDWHNALDDIDVIIHLAARVHVMNESSADPLTAFRKVNVDGTAQLAKQAATFGVKRFIYISSIKVNGEYTDLGDPFEEEKKPNPQDAYGVSKLEAEQRLLQLSKATEMEVVIIRPPLVYGEGVKANFKKLIKLSQSPIPLPFGAINNSRSLIYIENLIDFIVLCIRHPKAANETFLISDDDDVSTTKLIKTIAATADKNIFLLPIPQTLLTLLFNMIGKQSLSDRLCGNLQVDITKAKTLLGWKPVYSFSEGIKKTVQDKEK